MVKRRFVAVAALVVAASASLPLLPGASGAAVRSPAAPRALDDDVHLNEIQTIGSHNSYHLVPSKKERDLRRAAVGDIVDQMEYVHDPLPDQFSHQKVRQIELDLFLDTAGGLYSKPFLRSAAGLGDWQTAVMDQPGIKVLHVQDVDYRSTCLTLVECLTQIETWSDANPSHVPIAVLLELKDDELNIGGYPFVVPEKWGPAGLDALDAEIRSVFDPADMIVPDDVRGAHTTLDEAVTTDGWPSLADSRGKVMFMMDNGGQLRADYRAGGHSALQGRVLFTNSEPGDPDGGFVKRNDAHDPSIPGLVQQGYVVRTRADGDTLEARANDTTDRDAALASGAQWVSTDYPVPGMGFGFVSPYYAEIPGGTVARCNPVNAPQACVSAPLDTIFQATTTSTTTTTSSPTSTTLPDEATDPDAAPAATPVNGQSNFTG